MTEEESLLSDHAFLRNETIENLDMPVFALYNNAAE